LPWRYTDEDASSPRFAEIGYRKGVPKGGDLAHQRPRQAPSFLVSAVKDPHGANLDRVQVIKGWRDPTGTLHEQIHDVAWSDDRVIGEDGKLPAVGSTVDLETASYVNSIGSASLATIWTDPAFNPGEAAFYYVRVIQIPTPRSWGQPAGSHPGTRLFLADLVHAVEEGLVPSRLRACCSWSC